MKNKTIYLAGPILGRTDADCSDWRAFVEAVWPGACLNPLARRDCRGREDEPGIEIDIVEGDKADIDRADGVLVYFDQPSVGTAMEIHYAWTTKKPVVVIYVAKGPVSPWLRYHAKAIRFGNELGGTPTAAIRDALAQLSTLL